MTGLDLNVPLMKLLAVAGGAAVGYLLIGGLLRFAGKFFLRDKVPRVVHVGVRLLGGLTTGLLVWLWLFGVHGPGGWGAGGGGLFPFGGTGSTGGDGPKTTDPVRKTTDVKNAARGEALQVELLGGDNVKEQRFYQLEGGTALEFDELVKALVERRQKNPALKELRIVLRLDSVAHDHPAVTRLDKWARDNGMTPEVSKR